MAVNLLNDELKSDITKLIPPITKEQLVKVVNSLIYHFKNFGICGKEDILMPSGNDYLESVDTFNIVSDNFGSKSHSYIEKLTYINIPCELKDIVVQINLIINIIKGVGNYPTSSYFFEYLKYLIYKNTPSLLNKNPYNNYSYDSQESELMEKINNLNIIILPATYVTIVDTVNKIVDLYKGKLRIIDANDFRLMISSLKSEVFEVLDEGGLDYGDSSFDFIWKRDEYGKSTDIKYEFQANDEIFHVYLIDSEGNNLLDSNNNNLLAQVLK